jgi:hypothetical protein
MSAAARSSGYGGGGGVGGGVGGGGGGQEQDGWEPSRKTDNKTSTGSICYLAGINLL